MSRTVFTETRPFNGLDGLLSRFDLVTNEPGHTNQPSP
jgi:hypothetical protein